MRPSRRRPLRSSLDSSSERTALNVPGFRGGRSKLPLLLPKRNSISSYFTPSSKQTLRPFVPPRGSQSSQSSQDDSERGLAETAAEVKTEEEGGGGGEQMEREEAKEEKQIQVKAEAVWHDPGRPCATSRMEVVKKMKSISASHEVLVTRTPSPQSRFKVAPRPIMGQDSPSCRRLWPEQDFIENQVQVVVTSKYFSSSPTSSPQRSSPVCQQSTSTTVSWSSRPCALDPTTQSVEESDEEEMHPVAIQVKTEVAEVGPSPTTTPTPPSFFQRKRKRGMASPDAPSLSDSQSDGGDHEKEKEESPVKKTRPPPSAAEPIDLTVSELPTFESPMLSRGKRLSTPMGFLLRTRNNAKQAHTPTTTSRTPSAKIGDAVGTLYSYFNKQGFLRHSSPTSPSSSSGSLPAPKSAQPQSADEQQPTLEEDGLEICGASFTPHRQAGTTSKTTPPRAKAQDHESRVVLSPYFLS